MTIQMLQWPQKTSYEVKLEQPIYKFIKRTFDNFDQEQTQTACKEFDELRRISVNKAMDANQKATETIARYHDQIILLMAKVPLLENGVAINWNWKDAFDPRKQVNNQSGHWEAACVLYNLAAVKTALAAGRSQSDADGLKQAVGLFQQAAGIADHLAATTVKLIHQERLTKDLKPESLRALSTTCVAQAQEMVIINFKNKGFGLQAKLAQQAATLWADAVGQLSAAQAKPVNAVEFAQAKQMLYEARAQWCQGEAASAEQKHGEAIARLTIAVEKAGKAKKTGAKFRSSGIDIAANEILQQAQKKLNEVKKDNDFIYHDRVPPATTLSPIQNQVVAKPTPFNDRASAQPISDLFGHLVPIQVQQALTSFEQRRKFAVQTRINKLTEMTQMLDAVTQSLGVDATVDAIFSTAGTNQLPEQIKTGANHVRQLGGINHLRQMFSGLGPAMKMNQEVLAESQRLLDEEASTDEAYRVKYGVTKFDDPRWPRKPSPQLNHGYVTEIQKYRSIIENAIKADGIVTNKMNQHQEGIDILSRSEADIANYLGPGGSGDAGLASLRHDGTAIELKDYREQAVALKTVREVLEHQLRNEMSMDMSEKFGMALAKDGFVDEERISTEALDTLFVPLDKQIKEQEDSQDTVTRNLERCMQMVNSSKGSSSASDIQRTQAIGLLVAAENAFKELDKHLKEGTKFYSDLTQMLLKNQAGIQDFVQSRKLEAEQLISTLGSAEPQKSEISAPPTAQTNAPARPPPPQTSSAPSRPPPPQFSSTPTPAPRTNTAATPNTATAPPTTGYQPPMGYPQPYGMPQQQPQQSNLPYPVNPYPMPQPFGMQPPMQQPQQPYGMPQQPQIYGQPGAYPQQPQPGQPQVNMFGQPIQPQNPPQYGYPPQQ